MPGSVKNFILVFVLFLTNIIVIAQQNNDYLIKIHQGEYDEPGVNTAYVNASGDTIIPFNKYYYCYTDTLRNFAIVIDTLKDLIAIDKNENVLFEVFWCDNGPDYISDGLFRILKDDKIGYANEKGQIIIEPQFTCAFPFKNGIAKVSNDCSSQQDHEHTKWISDSWFFIDKSGTRIAKP